MFNAAMVWRGLMSTFHFQLCAIVFIKEISKRACFTRVFLAENMKLISLLGLFRFRIGIARVRFTKKMCRSNSLILVFFYLSPVPLRKNRERFFMDSHGFGLITARLINMI